MPEGDNPFLLPSPGPGLESGTRRLPRAQPDERPAAHTAAPVRGGAPLPSGGPLLPGGGPVLGGGIPAPSAPPGPAAFPGERVVWRLVFPGGAEVAVDGPVVLGRAPAAPDDVPTARPIALSDPQKTVSKTHALLVPEAAGLRVRDLHSSNGTSLVLAGGRVPAPVVGDLLVTEPAQLELGRYVVRVAPEQGA